MVSPSTISSTAETDFGYWPSEMPNFQDLPSNLISLPPTKSVVGSGDLDEGIIMAFMNGASHHILEESAAKSNLSYLTCAPKPLKDGLSSHRRYNWSHIRKGRACSNCRTAKKPCEGAEVSKDGRCQRCSVKDRSCSKAKLRAFAGSITSTHRLAVLDTPPGGQLGNHSKGPEASTELTRSPVPSFDIPVRRRRHRPGTACKQCAGAKLYCDASSSTSDLKGCSRCKKKKLPCSKALLSDTASNVTHSDPDETDAQRSSPKEVSTLYTSVQETDPSSFDIDGIVWA